MRRVISGSDKIQLYVVEGMIGHDQLGGGVCNASIFSMSLQIILSVGFGEVMSNG